MNYLLFITCSDGLPGPEAMAVMQRECPTWVQEMERRGVRLLGQELDLPQTAATVRVRDGETLVSDGPFAETKEFIAGFDVLDCSDLDEAIEVAAKHPTSWFDAIEVRPFRPGLELSETARRLAGENASPGTYCLMLCLDGVPAAPEEEATVARQGKAWAEDLRARGLQILGHPVAHKDSAVTVRVRDGETLVTPGPFVDTPEFIGGIDVITCAGREQAIEIAAAHPLASHHMIEVRPFYSG